MSEAAASRERYALSQLNAVNVPLNRDVDIIVAANLVNVPRKTIRGSAAPAARAAASAEAAAPEQRFHLRT